MWRRRLRDLALRGAGRRLRASVLDASGTAGSSEANPPATPVDPALPALGPRAVAWREDRAPLDLAARPRQGALGDCWVIASLLAAHEADPSIAARLVDLRADGNARVRLRPDARPSGRRRARPIDVVIDRRMPVTVEGHWAYAREEGRGPGWAGLVEKAAALEVAGSYRILAAGFGRFGLGLVTGLPVRSHLFLPSAARIDAWTRAGHALVASTHPLSPLVRTLHGPLPLDHVVAVVGADPRTGHVRVRNPWRPDDVLVLDARTFRRGFVSLDRTAVPVRDRAVPTR